MVIFIMGIQPGGAVRTTSIVRITVIKRNGPTESRIEHFLFGPRSTQGPESWELLVTQLKVRCHECICVDLPIDQPDPSAAAYASAKQGLATIKRLIRCGSLCS
jgi:hypothetical protein